MTTSGHGRAELCPLTDSLTSSIRWRMRDYEKILRAELALLAAESRTARELRPRVRESCY